jgi:iron complex outermembrane receptor protein
MKTFIFRLFSTSLLLGSIAILFIIAFMPTAVYAQTNSSSSQPQAAKDTVLPEVVVSETKEKQAAPKEGSAESGYKVTESMVGPLGNASVLDTPYSINATSGELIENRQVHTLYEAVQTNPAVSNLLLPNVQSSMVQLMIRGADASDRGEMRDGLVDRSFTNPPLENVERVEILNGFSSFLYGISNVGGAFNFISKQVTAKPMLAISVGQQGGGQNFIHLDFGSPIPSTGGRLKTRLNIYTDDGDSFLDNSKARRTLLSDVLSYQLTPRMEIKFDIYAQDAHQEGLATYFNAANYTDNMWTANGIDVPSASKFRTSRQYGQNWTYTESQKVYGGLLINSKLSRIFTVRAAGRYGQMQRGYNYIDAILTDNAGNYTEQLYDNVPQHERTNAEYGLLDASFNTKAVHHDITFGYTGNYYHFEKALYATNNLGVSSTDSPTTYANPHLTLPASNIVRDQPAGNVILGDHLRLTNALAALIGVNFAQIWYDAWNKTTHAHTSAYSQHAFTPTYALNYRLPHNISTYFSYMEGLNAGGSTSAAQAKNANEVLPPSVDSQYEIGAKAKVQGTQLSLALYRMNLVNEYLDPDDEIYKKDGRQINQGVEFNASGKPTNNLTVVGGFELMNSRITRERDHPAWEQKIPINVPEQQVRLYAEYNLPRATHLTPTCAVNYSGRRPVDSTNAHFLDGATILDTGLRYEGGLLNHYLKLAVNATNVGNKSYWATYYSGDGIILGQPRVVSFSAKYVW